MNIFVVSMFNVKIADVIEYLRIVEIDNFRFFPILER